MVLPGLLLALLVPPATRAASILIGGPPDPAYGSCVPLGCTNFGPSTIYQQVYASSNFTAPLMIRSLTFYSTVSPHGTIVDADYSFSLSTTTRAVNTLDTTFSNNPGADSQLFWQGRLYGEVQGSLTVTGTPFEYRPSMGNLLLEVRRLTPGASLTGGIAFDARNGTSAGAFSRMSNYYQNTNAAYNNNQGLVTTFSDQIATPEPGAALLISGGLAALWWTRRRRAA
jgi:hypothetical protein